MYSTYVNSARHQYDALLYGAQNPAMVDYLYGQLDQSAATMGYTPEYYNQMRGMLDQYNSAYVIERSRQIAAELTEGSTLDVGIIRSYSELLQFQEASVTMQRWIMANPVVRQAWMDGTIDGYSDTYHDAFPKTIAEDHHDWRLVNDGMLVVEENDWYTQHFFQDRYGEDRELSHEEKIDILDSWNVVEMLVAMGKADPTDVYGGSL